MIPTMIVLGLVIGLLPRPWYGITAVLAGISWVVLLGSMGTIAISDVSEVLSTFLFGLVNVLVGVAITRAVRLLIRSTVRET